MREFKVGEFHRQKVVSPLRAFCPIETALKLHDVNLVGLYARGKRLLLLDVDNTMTQWRSEEISTEVRDWIKEAKSAGFKLCILSNTRHPDRLQRLAADVDVPYLRGRFKPSRRMYFEALEKYDTEAENAIMVGDQLLTDILGANRSGIEAIWVQSLGHREFKGTKISRWVERRLVGFLYNAIVEPIDAEPEAPAIEGKKPFWERTIVKQLVKFGIVGGTSFAIDAGLSYLLTTKLRTGGELASPQLGEAIISHFVALQHLSWFQDAKTAGATSMSAMASLVAMLNSFMWNRRWTFETRGPEQRLSQLRRFMEISIIGYLIQNAVFASLAATLHISAGPRIIFAKVPAAAIAAFWNFAGQRLYAFRKKRP